MNEFSFVPRFGRLLAAAPLALLAALATAPLAEAQTQADVPGTVVYWRISPFSNFFGSDRIYTTSPSIVVLPDGDYLLSFNLFGASLSPPASESGTTYIYRSSDKGATWTNLTPSPMMDMKRGSLFVHQGDAYLWGYQSDSGTPRILKSTDKGTTWSAPVQLDTGTRSGTPMNPVFWTDETGTPRVWCSVGGRRMMSGRADLDLMDPSNWSSVGSNAELGQLPDFPSGTWEVISEAQIVASPQTGVVVMPKVQFTGVTPPYFSYSIQFRRQPGANNTLQAAGPEEWVALPGADKKFGAGYDPVSGRFYVISNPVLPAHFGYSEPWNMIRNTAALMSSADLQHWDVQQIFMYGPNIGYEGWQYLNFDIDGEDMVIASRTAFDISGEPGVSYPPPRGHDSNLITFHRIADFRTAMPDHYLAISGGVVRRHERTQHAPAPLGNFVMGTSFAGAPLGAVDGLAHGQDGEVLVRGQGGRVLRFDPLGNFLGTGSAQGVTFHSQIDVAQPPPGERGWTLAGDGDWDDLHNWHYWNRADTGDETANFGSAISANATVTLNRARTVHGLRFRSAHRYTIAGGGSLVLATAFDAPVAGSLEAELAGGATVRGLTQDAAAYPLGYYASGNPDREIIGVVGASGNRRNHSAILVFDLPEVLPEGAGGWELTFHKSGLGSSQRRVDLYSLDPRGEGFALDETLWHEGGVANNLVDTRPFATLLVSELMVNDDPIGNLYAVDVTSAIASFYNGRNRAPGVDKVWFRLSCASTPGIGADNRYQSIHNTPGQDMAPTLTLTVFEPVPVAPALAEAVEGAHYVDVPVQLGTDAVITAHAGAELRLRGGLDIAGRTAQFGGAGIVRVGETLALNFGALVLEGLSGLRLGTGATARFSGILEWRPGGEVVFNYGDTFMLFPNLESATVEGAFDEVLLPELAPGLEWDLTALYTSGQVSVDGEPPVGPAALRVGISYDGGVSLTIDGPSGADYLIQVSTDLDEWEDAETVSPPVVPFDWTDPDGPVSGARFYRVKSPPN